MAGRRLRTRSPEIKGVIVDWAREGKFIAIRVVQPELQHAIFLRLEGVDLETAAQQSAWSAWQSSISKYNTSPLREGAGDGSRFSFIPSFSMISTSPARSNPFCDAVRFKIGDDLKPDQALIKQDGATDIRHVQELRHPSIFGTGAVILRPKPSVKPKPQALHPHRVLPTPPPNRPWPGCVIGSRPMTEMELGNHVAQRRDVHTFEAMETL